MDMAGRQPFWLFGILVFCSLWMGSGCKQVALVEQLHNIPNGSWQSSRTDTFKFDITDTTSLYNIAVVVRHTYRYPYRNLWVKAGIQQPGEDSLRFQQFDLPLATADSWLGVGMGDIYEVRPRLFPKAVNFPTAGQIIFTLQHIMRQPALDGVMQVGIRVEPE